MTQAIAYEAWDVPALAEPAEYSAIGEWYLVFCMAIMALEGVFTTHISNFIGSNFILTRIAGYAIWPTEWFFLSFGLLIGVFLVLGGRRQGATYGAWAFVAIWLVHLVALGQGWSRRYPFWNVDFRFLILTSIIVPWVAALGGRVRLDVVLSRFIWFCVPLAFINMWRGLEFMGMGVAYRRGWTEKTWNEGIVFQADLCLLVAYLAALSRLVVYGRKGLVVIAILAAGIIAPLNKIAIAAFLFGTVVAILLGQRVCARHGFVERMRSLLLLFLVGGVLAGVGAGLLLSRGGAGMRFLMERTFKVHQAVASRDLSTGRLALWRQALDQFRSSPIFGLGLGSRLYSAGRDAWLQYHNYYVRWLAQMGLVGFLVIVLSFLFWMRRAWRTLAWEPTLERRWGRVAMVTFVVTMMFSGLYTEALASPAVAYVFWTAVALEAAAHTRVLREGLTETYNYDEEYPVNVLPAA